MVVAIGSFTAVTVDLSREITVDSIFTRSPPPPAPAIQEDISQSQTRQKNEDKDKSQVNIFTQETPHLMVSKPSDSETEGTERIDSRNYRVKKIPHCSGGGVLGFGSFSGGGGEPGPFPFPFFFGDGDSGATCSTGRSGIFFTGQSSIS